MRRRRRCLPVSFAVKKCCKNSAELRGIEQLRTFAEFRRIHLKVAEAKVKQFV
jgi:hypothetical protein